LRGSVTVPSAPVVYVEMTGPVWPLVKSNVQPAAGVQPVAVLLDGVTGFVV
jgi:hypothetical protein